MRNILVNNNESTIVKQITKIKFKKEKTLMTLIWKTNQLPDSLYNMYGTKNVCPNTLLHNII